MNEQFYESIKLNIISLIGLYDCEEKKRRKGKDRSLAANIVFSS